MAARRPSLNVSYKNKKRQSFEMAPIMHLPFWFERSVWQTNKSAEEKFDKFLKKTGNVFDISPERRTFLDSTISHENSFFEESRESKICTDPDLSRFNPILTDEKVRYSAFCFSRVTFMHNEIKPFPSESKESGSDESPKSNVSLHNVTVRKHQTHFKKEKLKFSVSEPIAESEEAISEEEEEEAQKTVPEQLVEPICSALNEPIVESIQGQKVSPAERLFKICNLQNAPVPFSGFYSARLLKNCVKIAEGTYGEVFYFKSGRKSDSFVSKIIAIDDNDFESQCSKMLPELVITLHLSNLRDEDSLFYTDAFPKVNRLILLKGKYPQSLIRLWEEFDLKTGSENESPVIYPDDKLYVGIHMEHSGEPLDKFKFNSAAQTYHAIIQVIFALAVAEAKFKFEHRDLHLGNVLVKKTLKKIVCYKLNGVLYHVPSFSLKVSIIDFSLSRKNEEDGVLYNDLETDEDIFKGQGDLQYEMYRQMRAIVGKDWSSFNPKTNVLWIYFLSKKCRNLHYGKKETKKSVEYVQKLYQLGRNILQFNSTLQAALSFGEFQVS